MVLLGSVTIILVSILLISSFANPSLNDRSANDATEKTISLKLTETFDEAIVFVPNTIYIDKGDKVKMIIINGADDDTYSFIIPDLNIKSDPIPPLNGQTEIFFEATATGTYQFNVEEDGDDEESEINPDDSEEVEEISIPSGEIIIEDE